MTAIVIFLKYPEPGRVKTRLAREVGPKRATEVYESLLSYTLTQIAALDRKKFTAVAYCDPFRPIEDYRAYLRGFPGDFEMQSGADLGERLLAATSKELNRHEKVLIIGTDCPQLQTKHLNEADSLLSKNDVVLGPAKDGGYYLIGMNHFHSTLFENIPWSTETVCDLTEEKAKLAQLKVHRLETLFDIDTEEDLRNASET